LEFRGRKVSWKLTIHYDCVGPNSTPTFNICLCLSFFLMCCKRVIIGCGVNIIYANSSFHDNIQSLCYIKRDKWTIFSCHCDNKLQFNVWDGDGKPTSLVWFFLSVRSLKLHVQSTGKHVAPLEHIILIKIPISLCFCSSKLRAQGRRNKYQLLVRDMLICSSGATCLPTDCCFSELILCINIIGWSCTKLT